MPKVVGYTEVMEYGEFRNAVRKAREVRAHVVIYADDYGDACDGDYIKVTKSDLLKQTQGYFSGYFKASWGVAEHNKDVLFIN